MPAPFEALPVDSAVGLVRVEQMTRPAPRKAGLLGRTSDLKHAANVLQENDLALWGLPGCGKTAMAAQLAADFAQAKTFEEVFWLNVGYTEPGLQPAWRRDLVTWAVAPTSDGARRDIHAGTATVWEVDSRRTLEFAHGQIGDREVLLIFDDVWRDDEALGFGALGSGCRRLMTTRRDDLAYAFAQSPDLMLRVDELDRQSSRELLKSLVSPAVLSREEELEQVVQLTAGLPLAVVIAGNYLRMNSKVPSQLTQAFDDLRDSGKRLAIEAHLPDSQLTLLPEGSPRTMQAIIHMSASHLKQDDIDALGRLAVFPPKANSFSTEAAEAVAGARDAVINLRAAGLLDAFDQEAARLTMHQTIQDYAKQAATADTREAYLAMIEFLAALAKKLGAFQRTTDDWLQALDDERANILAAIQWAVEEGEGEAGFRLATSLWVYWYQAARFQDGLEWASRLLPLPLSDDESHLEMRSLLRNVAGNCAFNLGDLSAAAEHHVAALRLRARLGRQDLLAGTWNNLALIKRARGSYAAAEAGFRRALSVNETESNRLWQAMNWNNLGGCAEAVGHLNDAEKFHKTARDIFDGEGNAWGLAMVRTDLANVYLRSGRTMDAEALAKAAIRDRLEALDHKWLSSGLRVLARVAIREQEFANGLRNALAAAGLSAGIGDRAGEAISLAISATCLAELDQPREAAKLCGVVDAFRATCGHAVPPTARGEIAAFKGGLASRLGVADFKMAVAEGETEAVSGSSEGPSSLRLEQISIALLQSHGIDVDATLRTAVGG